MIEKIKAYRHQIRLSQAEFADRFGIPMQTYVQWERGRREPDQAAHVLLAVILDHPDLVNRAARRINRHAMAAVIRGDQ